MNNPQIQGPLVLDTSRTSPASVYLARDRSSAVAKIYLTDPHTKKRTAQYSATAELMVGAYNAFDTAARELGIDAKALLSLDLAEVVRYARDYASLPSVAVGRPDQVEGARRLFGSVFPPP